MSDAVYKLVDRQEWDAAGDRYAGSPLDLADGYIHLSTSAQLAETAAKHYRGRSGLTLVALDPAPLGETLRWEPSRGGALFPHLYAPLRRADALWTRHLAVDDQGVMRFDDGATGWP